VRTIRVYGELAKLLGQRIFRAEVETVGEAVRFILANFPNAKEHISEQAYRIKSGRHILDEEEITLPTGREETISIIPVYVGAGAVGRIIAGAALIAASFLIGPAALLGIAIAPIVFSVGASLVLGGIAQLLAPTPKIGDREKDPRESYNFSGIQNTTRSGLPVPIIYGEIFTGSLVISAGISTERI
jgi:predicted phage tail protein